MHTVVIYLSISTNIFLAWLAQGKLSLNLSLLAGGEHSPFPWRAAPQHCLVPAHGKEVEQSPVMQKIIVLDRGHQQAYGEEEIFLAEGIWLNILPT